jgi:hypothetical protein
MDKKMIVVFGDGETWSMADDVVICDITEKQFNELEQGKRPKDFYPVLWGVHVNDAMNAHTKLEALHDPDFGKEAEELRKGIEELVEKYTAGSPDDAESQLDDLLGDMRKLLDDKLDARDSLHYCATQTNKQAEQPKTEEDEDERIR